MEGCRILGLQIRAGEGRRQLGDEGRVHAHPRRSRRCEQQQQQGHAIPHLSMRLIGGRGDPVTVVWVVVPGFLRVQYSAIARIAVLISILITLSYQMRPVGKQQHGIEKLGNLTLGLLGSFSFVVVRACAPPFAPDTYTWMRSWRVSDLAADYDTSPSYQ